MDVHVRKLYHARYNAMLMMRARGMKYLPNKYFPSNESPEERLSFDEFHRTLNVIKRWFGPGGGGVSNLRNSARHGKSKHPKGTVSILEAMGLVFQPPSDTNDDDNATSSPCFVIFHVTKIKLDVAFVRLIMASFGRLCVVLVAETALTSFAKTEFLESTDCGNQFFLLDELQFPLLTYIPLHRALTSTEHAAFVKKHFITNYTKQLPQLQRTDPVCRFYNWDVGTIVEIVRPNLNGDVELYYRVVIRA